MFEIKLCRHGYQKAICVACPVEPVMRACADCEAYAPLAKMNRKSDGRVICRSCENQIQQSAQAKAQGDLFTEQKGLFQ